LGELKRCLRPVVAAKWKKTEGGKGKEKGKGEEREGKRRKGRKGRESIKGDLPLPTRE